jgi:NitT/TauT family transport system substrate-binding protein
MLKLSAWLRWVFLALIAFTLTIACTQQPNTTTTTPGASSTPAASSQPIASGLNSWVGYSSHYVATKQDLFTKEGLNVQEIFFQSATEEITAMLAGKLDIGWLTSGDAIQAAAKDSSLKIVYLVDYSDGADGIIGKNIATPKDAKGKSLARENLLFTKVLLQAYLKQAGLTEADLKVKDMTAAESATAFAAKQVDLAVTYEPFLTKNAKLGGGNVVFSTKDTNLVADVLVVRDKFLKTRSKDLQAYFRAVDKAVKLVIAADPEALKIAGAKMGVTAAEVKEQLAGVKLFDLATNKAMAFDKSNPKSLIGNLELTAKAAEEFKIIPQPLKPESLYDDSIVKSL